MFRVHIQRTPFFEAPHRSTFILYSFLASGKIGLSMSRDEIFNVFGSTKAMEFVPFPYFCFLFSLLSSITKSLSITQRLFTWSLSLFYMLQRSSVAVMTVLE